MQYLNRLEQQLKEKNQHPLNYLKPGLTDNALHAFFNKYSLPFSEGDALVDIYRWRNGTRTNTHENQLDLCLFPNYIFLSLEEMEKAIESDVLFNLKERGLIPLFSDCDGGLIVLSAAEYTTNPGHAKLYFCSPTAAGDKNIFTIYSSLTIMLDCIVNCYENNIYFINEEDFFIDCKYSELYALARKKNPDSDFWISGKVA